MNRTLLALLTAMLFSAAVPAADVGISLSIGQPGFYGRLDIGDYPRPSLMYTRPVIIQRAPRGTVFEPIYLHVPPGQAKNWKRYCGRYDACGRPVYFVQDRWYNDVYVPRYRERNNNRGRDDGRDDDRGRGRDNDKGDHDRGNDNRGNGRDRDDRH